MSYHALGVTDADLYNPDSDYWLGPFCAGGQRAYNTLEYQAAAACANAGAGGLGKPDYTHPLSVLGKPNSWKYSGTCANGGRVRVQVACSPVGPNGFAGEGFVVEDSLYTPPGYQSPATAPPLPTQQCPNGPPQPYGKCCPSGYVGTAPNCNPVGPIAIIAPQNTSGNVVTDTRNISGRPGPASSLPTFYNMPGTPSIAPQTSYIVPKASGGGPVLSPWAFVLGPSRDEGVTVGPSAPPADSKAKWFVAACVAVAVVSVGAMGYAYYSSGR